MKRSSSTMRPPSPFVSKGGRVRVPRTRYIIAAGHSRRQYTLVVTVAVMLRVGRLHGRLRRHPRADSDVSERATAKHRGRGRPGRPHAQCATGPVGQHFPRASKYRDRETGGGAGRGLGPCGGISGVGWGRWAGRQGWVGGWGGGGCGRRDGASRSGARRRAGSGAGRAAGGGRAGARHVLRPHGVRGGPAAVRL